MTEIAGYVGRAACAAIGSFVPRCQSGQSVDAIGYATAALVMIFCGTLAFLKRS
jgi:hypothetical protein